MIDYSRVATAIEYIHSNYRTQPSLDEVADAVHLSPHHFQRIFKEWAGVSPKKFLQFVSLGHAKQLLMDQNSLLTTSYETGFSGSSRLHDLFVTIEGMTPGDYKGKGASLQIEYQVYNSLFGEVLIANTTKGVCLVSFLDDTEGSEEVLQSRFPDAVFTRRSSELQLQALKPLSGEWSDLGELKLHLKGTPFQLKVWEALLKVPFAKTTTYGQLASLIDSPKASRAVGSAVGSNPIAYLIPCHRVIRSTGVIGDYHWGPIRKTAILGWENCQHQSEVA